MRRRRVFSAIALPFRQSAFAAWRTDYCHPERSEGPGGAGARCLSLEPPPAQVPRYARDDSDPYVPAGRPRGEGLEMSIIAMRSFSSYQQWKRLMPGTSMS